MMERLSRFILKHRGPIALIFVSVLIFFSIATLRLESDFTPDALIQAGDPDQVVWKEIREVFGDTERIVHVIIEGPDVFQAEFLRALKEIGNEIHAIRGVGRVVHLANVELIRGEEGGFTTDPLVAGDLDDPANLEAIHREALSSRLIRGTIVSVDGTTTALTANLTEKLTTVKQRTAAVNRIEAIIRTGLPAGFVCHFAGIPVVDRDYAEVSRDGQMFFVPAAIVLIVAVLLIIFRSTRGVVVPLLIMGSSMGLTLGMIVLFGKKLNVINTTIPLIILIIGVADSIHMLTRYYEEVARGAKRDDAIRAMAAHVGWACFLTSVTTAIGFASLGMARMTMIREYGLLVAGGIMIIYLTTLLLAPILLSLWPAPKPAAVAKVGGGRIYGFVDVLERTVQRHTTAVLLVFGVAMLPAIWGVFRLEVGQLLLDEVSMDHPLRAAYRVAEIKLSGVRQIAISVRGEGENSVLEPEVLKAIDGLGSYVEKQKGVLKTISVVDYLKEMNRATFEGRTEQYRIPESRELAAQYLLLYSFGDETESLQRIINYDQDNNWTMLYAYSLDSMEEEFFEKKRAIDAYIAEHFPPSVQAGLAGGELVWNKGLRGITRDMIVSFATAFVAIFIVMLISFRSLRLAALAMIPNLFPILMTVGFMGLTGVRMRLGSIIVFSVGLGIAVDDTIHILARFRAERRRTGDLALAFSRTIHSTGRAVIFTTVVLVAGFLVFLPSGFLALRQMGMLNAITLTAALVADLILLPALLFTFRKAIGPGGRTPGRNG